MALMIIMALEMLHTHYVLLLHLSLSCLLALVIASFVGLRICEVCCCDSPLEWDDDDAWWWYEEDYDAPLPYYEPLHIHDDEINHFHPWQDFQ